MADNLDPIPITPGRSEIIDIYTQAVMNLRGIVTGEDYTTVSKRQAGEKIIDIQRLVLNLKKEHADWAFKFIPESYKIGLTQDKKILERALRNRFDDSYSGLHVDSAKLLSEGVVQDFNTVADALEQSYVGYVRRAQYIGNKRKIAEQIAVGAIEGATRQTVSNRLFSVMRDNVVKGKITVGKVTMNARSYAELLARTVARGARTEGTINNLNHNGVDLVVITNTGAVDFCQIFEDQIFSVSGRSRKYPKLVHRPPFHPNCTHNLSAFIEEFSKNSEIELGSQFKARDSKLSAYELNKKYPISEDDRRTRTKKTQKKAA